MNRQMSNAVTVLTALVILVGIACVGLAGLAGYTLTLDSEGLEVRNLAAEAQATKTAQEAQDQAAQRELELEAAEAAQPAWVVREVLIALGLGVAVVVVLVGASFALVAWMNKRAMSVYPDEKGQFPVMIRRGFGWLVMHDPNRGLGPAAVYQTPTVLHVLADVVHYLKTGRAGEQPQPEAAFPATASEATMAQVAGQAQAVGLMAAVTRPAGVLGGQALDRKEARQLAGEVVRKTSVLPETMPVVRVIDDPQRIHEFAQLLEGGGV